MYKTSLLELQKHSSLLQVFKDFSDAAQHVSFLNSLKLFNPKSQNHGCDKTKVKAGVKTPVLNSLTWRLDDPKRAFPSGHPKVTAGSERPEIDYSTAMTV